MFKGLLNRVRVDLVCAYFIYPVPNNRQQRPMGETGQVSARL